METPPLAKPEPLWWTIVRLLRWDKPEGRLILMVPALWAVCLAAAGKPDPLLVAVIVLGSLTTSAAGCVVNDLWDRNIDPQVERTRTRPLASRALTVQTGIGVLILSLICAWGLSLFLNPLSFWLCVAAVPVILLYPLAKRVFPVPQLVLAIAWGFAVLISWTAVSTVPEPPMFWLWGATVWWTLGFDTVYAMADREDDRKIGIQSSALFFGDRAPLAVAFFLVATVGCLVVEGVLLGLNGAYWLSLAIATLLWGRHVVQLRPEHLPGSVYGRIFRQNVWIGFILLVGMLVGTLPH